ncbi:MAG: transketolase [Ignavibacteriales bacterium]|nr:transketolase [Ignavibacteriales bacterium]
MPQSDLDHLSINTIRTLAMDAVQAAKSGHPGMPMGAAPMAYVLWTKFLKHNPANPHWHNRDRFVLSAGHGCMLLYSLLHLTGYDLTLDDLRNFRQWESKTPGHPESHLTTGVETTTGPLGQGFANGIGLAIAQKYLAARYNRPGFPVVDYRIYAIVSDGDLMEGVASEAASLAGHLKLDNLVYLYDDNHISIDGPTTLAFTEDAGKRFEAYGWHVQTVNDGNDLEAIRVAIETAGETKGKPHLIKVRTHIGFGSPNKQDTAEAHGAPLGEEEVRATKKNLGWDPESRFLVPDQALAHFRDALDKGKKDEKEWVGLWERYRSEFPDLVTELEWARKGNFDGEWKKSIPVFTEAMATREASGKVLNAVAAHLPTLIGGSADLTPSNNTYLKGFPEFQAGSYEGRNLRFGVREHAMGSVLNGIALTPGMIPYGGTFLIFSEYMRPPIRLACIMGIRPIYVFTHDSIGLGEDGPTHQPIEQLASLRSIPNMTVIRPADANETAVAWTVAIEHTGGPVALALTRQKVPLIDRTRYAPAAGLTRGAYVLAETAPSPDLILIGTGSEVQHAIGAYEILAKEGVKVRVVGMPSWELFERQLPEYRESVLPSTTHKRLAIEAGVVLGWHRYLGPDGEIICMNRFGASAPGDRLMKEFGFTVENVLKSARRMIAS